MNGQMYGDFFAGFPQAVFDKGLVVQASHGMTKRWAHGYYVSFRVVAAQPNYIHGILFFGGTPEEGVESEFRVKRVGVPMKTIACAGGAESCRVVLAGFKGYAACPYATMAVAPPLVRGQCAGSVSIPANIISEIINVVEELVPLISTGHMPPVGAQPLHTAWVGR